MKTRTIFYAIVAGFCFGVLLFAEDKLTPKDTPASQSLIKAAKDQVDDQAALNLKFQQARSTLDTGQKAVTEALQKDQKQLQDELAKDKHYKPLLDRINTEQKQLQDLSVNAQQQFNKDSAQLQQKLQSDSAQVGALLPVVRKENGWGDTVGIDGKTGTFVDNKKK